MSAPMLSARGRHVVRDAVARAIRTRVRAGATIAAEAARYGVTTATVARWVAGDGYPSFTAAVRIAPLVGVDPETGRAAS